MAHRTPLLILPLLACLACGRSKTPTVVVVSVDQVAHESVQAKNLIGEVETFAKSVEDRLNQAAQQVQAAARDPRRKPDEVRFLQTQLGQMRVEAQEQVDLRKRQAEQEIHGAMEKALGMLAHEQGWELVVRKDAHAALWSSDLLDQTDMVIKRMDSLALAPMERP
jgi:Skp family chaperone for outer membrane proteins